MTEVRLMDMNRIMSAYGFKGGVFNVGNPILSELDSSAEKQFGSIEGDLTLVDNQEEFASYVLFKDLKISYNLQKVVDQELPKGEEGAKRLCSIWLKKVAEYPENSKQYWDAIAIVKQKANEKYGVILTDEQITTYYAESMKTKIYGTPIQLLTKEEQNQVKELLLDYFLNPTKDNATKFREYSKSVYAFNAKKSGEIVAFIARVSPSLAGKLV